MKDSTLINAEVFTSFGICRMFVRGEADHRRITSSLQCGSVRQRGNTQSLYTGILVCEPGLEKTCLRGFRPGLTQTRLYNHRRWLDAGNFIFEK